MAAIGSKYIGYVLAVAWQSGEQAAGSEIVGKVFDKRTSGQVPVSTNHDVTNLIQPRFEGFESFG